MDPVLTYRGRAISRDDVAFIRELIAAHPDASRRGLSYKLCEAWSWVQPNGVMSDMLCRGLMLALHRAGHIELPQVRQRPRNNIVARARPAPVDIDRSPIGGMLAALGGIELRQVRRAGAEEALFDGLVEEHHYLGYTRPVGEHLKFLAYAKERPLACFVWSSSLPRLTARDRFIGWSPSARARNIRLVAYNSRFLILPWVEVRHLASHLLGRMTRELSCQWEQVYDHPILLAETYVDRTRFAGTCYRAANWIHLGKTAGRGNRAPTLRPTRSKKDVLVLPLGRRFREVLGRET
jgi:Druantia protein DruA